MYGVTYNLEEKALYVDGEQAFTFNIIAHNVEEFHWFVIEKASALCFRNYRAWLESFPGSNKDEYDMSLGFAVALRNTMGEPRFTRFVCGAWLCKDIEDLQLLYAMREIN